MRIVPILSPTIGPYEEAELVVYVTVEEGESQPDISLGLPYGIIASKKTNIQGTERITIGPDRSISGWVERYLNKNIFIDVNVVAEGRNPFTRQVYFKMTNADKAISRVIGMIKQNASNEVLIVRMHSTNNVVPVTSEARDLFTSQSNIYPSYGPDDELTAFSHFNKLSV